MSAGAAAGARAIRLAQALVVLAACTGASTPPEPATSEPRIPPGPYVAGTSYFSRNDYVEYIAGDSPVIYSAPHGGALRPGHIPDRTVARCGESVVTGADLNTADLVRRIQQAHFARTGAYPHVVVNHLHRTKLDANRPLADAACGAPDAEEAWDAWHRFIEVARAEVVATSGRGWYMDVHGHGHAVQRLELGYLLGADALRQADAALDAAATLETTSSVAALSRETPVAFSELLRGPSSLGSLYAAAGFPAVPSSGDPAPADGEAYFSGGYNTGRHGCRGAETAPGGVVCGSQLEANFTGVRDDSTNRIRFAAATAAVVEEYLWRNWGLTLARASR